MFKQKVSYIPPLILNELALKWQKKWMISIKMGCTAVNYLIVSFLFFFNLLLYYLTVGCWDWKRVTQIYIHHPQCSVQQERQILSPGKKPLILHNIKTRILNYDMKL